MADYAAAYGAGGAVDALRQIVADKLYKEKQAEAFRQARAAEMEAAAERTQRADQARALLAERVADRASTERRNYEVDLRDTRREDARLQERQIEREIGAKDKIDTRAQHVADVKANQDFLNLQREDTQKFMAGQQQAALANAREIAGMRPSHERTIKVSHFDKATGTNVDEYLTESEARARGVLDSAQKNSGGAKTMLADLNEAERLASSVLEKGKAIGWRGIGPVAGPYAGFKNKYLGGTDARVAQIQTQIGNLYSLISHERFGSALTSGEQERAKAFLPSRDDSVLDLKVKLADMLDFVRSKRASLTGIGTRTGRMGGPTEPAMPAAPGMMSSHGTSAAGDGEYLTGDEWNK